MIIKRFFNSVFKYKSLVFLLTAVFLYFLGRLMNGKGDFINQFYSSTINKWLIQVLSHITAIVPFSVGEIIVVTHVIAVPILLGIFIYKYKLFFKFLRFVVAYVSMIYILFMLLWGFNYSRISIGEIMELDVRPSDKQELYDISKDLILKANELRLEIEEDENGVMMIDGGFKSVFDRAHKGYDMIGDDYPVLSGSYGRPKYVLLSQRMLYTGIVGIYFPFTAEANVNVATPILFTPVDALHEMAHQRGFASEDEANYIAYLTASVHPDVDFQYSGTVSALTSTMGSLWGADPEKAAELYALFSDGLKRDLDHYNAFWKDYESEVGEVAEKVNDSYLKGNGQTDGVQSYGRVVDLLLAHYRKFGDI